VILNHLFEGFSRLNLDEFVGVKKKDGICASRESLIQDKVSDLLWVIRTSVQIVENKAIMSAHLIEHCSGGVNRPVVYHNNQIEQSFDVRKEKGNYVLLVPNSTDYC
jgi:hypothetical protein